MLKNSAFKPTSRSKKGTWVPTITANFHHVSGKRPLGAHPPSTFWGKIPQVTKILHLIAGGGFTRDSGGGWPTIRFEKFPGTKILQVGILCSAIYKPFRPFGRGATAMVINHLSKSWDKNPPSWRMHFFSENQSCPRLNDFTLIAWVRGNDTERRCLGDFWAISPTP